MRASASGLDGGVQRQQVGLFGDFRDHADDLGNLFRGFGDGAHAAHGGSHRPAAGLGGLRHRPAVLGGLRHRLVHLFHRLGDLVDGLGHIHHFLTLLPRGFHHLGAGLAHFGDTIHGGVHFLVLRGGGCGHVLHGLQQRDDRGIGTVRRLLLSDRRLRYFASGGTHFRNNLGGGFGLFRFNLGAFAVGARTLGDFAGAGVHDGRRAAHHPEGVANDLHHLVERRRHAADFVLAFHRHGQREVAVGGDLGDGAGHAGDRSGDQASDEQRQERDGDSDHDRHDDHGVPQRRHRLEGLGQILLDEHDPFRAERIDRREGTHHLVTPVILIKLIGFRDFSRHNRVHRGVDDEMLVRIGERILDVTRGILE